MKRLLPLFVLVVVTGSVHLHAQVPTYKFTQNYMTEDSVEFKCCFYVPRDYDSTQSYPFLYSWHGAGMEARTMRDLMMNTIAKDINAIVVAPEFNNVQTNAHLNFLLDTTLNFTRGTYNLDPARSILTGYSAGGRIAFSLGLYYPDLWGGIIGFAPAFGDVDMDDTMWAHLGDIRMATIIGDQDFNFPYEDGFWKDIPSKGANLLYIVKEGVQHSDAYYGSQEFHDDYRKCYDYVTGATSFRQIPEATSASLDVYPQPVREAANVLLNIPTAQCNVTVTDALGREVYRSGSVPGQSALQIKTSAWTPGTYFVRIPGEAAPLVKKIVVAR